MKKKLLSVALATIIAVMAVTGATLAWLTDTTDPVTNTFSPSNIDLELAETTGDDYKMVPGTTITKDPVVTVKGDSEACWLFIKIVESANFRDFMTYSVAEGWTPLEGVAGVYYREVSASATNEDQKFDVLLNDQVTVKDTVTKAMMDDLESGKADEPTLTFTAYAVQKDGMADAATAWAKVQ